jgi:hypothetical protein
VQNGAFLMQVMMRPMFGAYGKAGSSNSIAFVSKVRLTTYSSNKFMMMSNVQYYHLQSRKSVTFYFSSQRDIYSPLHLVLVYQNLRGATMIVFCKIFVVISFVHMLIW